MSRTSTDIHNHIVVYNSSQDNISEGIFYLKESLSADESNAFFDQVKSYSSGRFQNKHNHDFVMTYTNGEFVLVALSNK